MAMRIRMKNIFGALGALSLVLGAGPALAAEAFKAGLMEVFAARGTVAAGFSGGAGVRRRGQSLGGRNLWRPYQ